MKDEDDFQLELPGNRDFSRSFKDSLFETADDLQAHSTSMGRNSIGGLDAENARALLREEAWEGTPDVSGEGEELGEYAGNNYWRSEGEYKVEDLVGDYS